MARLTRSELATQVKAWVPDKQDIQIEAAANFIIRDLNSDKYPFTKGRVMFTTTAPEEVVVDATGGSLSVLYASAAAGHLNQIIQIESSDTWYEIVAVEVGVGFTLDAEFEGDTDAAATATIAYPRVQLPADLLEIEDISRPGKTPLIRVEDEIPSGYTENYSVREPTHYYEVDAENDSDSGEIFLLPPPDDRHTYLITGKKRIARFSGDSSRSGIPEKFEHVLIAGTVFVCLDQEDGAQQSAFWASLYRDYKKDLKHTGPAFTGVIQRIRRPVGHSYVNQPEIATPL